MRAASRQCLADKSSRVQASRTADGGGRHGLDGQSCRPNNAGSKHGWMHADALAGGRADGAPSRSIARSSLGRAVRARRRRVTAKHAWSALRNPSGDPLRPDRRLCRLLVPSGETEDDFQLTLDFLAKNAAYIDEVNPSDAFTAIIPGTELFARAAAFGVTDMDTAWFWEADGNDFAVRLDRFERLCRHVKRLGRCGSRWTAFRTTSMSCASWWRSCAPPAPSPPRRRARPRSA